MPWRDSAATSPGLIQSISSSVSSTATEIYRIVLSSYQRDLPNTFNLLEACTLPEAMYEESMYVYAQISTTFKLSLSSNKCCTSRRAAINKCIVSYPGNTVGGFAISAVIFTLELQGIFMITVLEVTFANQGHLNIFDWRCTCILLHHNNSMHSISSVYIANVDCCFCVLCDIKLLILLMEIS